MTIALISSFGCGVVGGQGLPTTITVATDGNQTKLFQGLSLTITATVMHLHGRSPGVTWSLSGANCPNNCGSLSTTSANPVTYTAPQTVSANFTVTVTATADADATLKASVNLNIVSAPCPSGNDAVLNGQYAFLLQGSDSSGIVATAGSFTADGAGNITAGLEDISRKFGNLLPPMTILSQGSSYSVGPDNRGCLTLVNSQNMTTMFRFAVGAIISGTASKGRIIEFDDASGTGTRAEGIIRKQDPTAFSTTKFVGNYVFGWVGVDPASGNRTVSAGVVNASMPGLISTGKVDTNDAGTVSNAIVAGSGISLAANGRGTIVLNLQGAPGPSIIFYMVSSQEIITLSAPGTAPIQTGEFFQQAMISFTNSTLNADAVAYSSGFQSSSAGPDVSIGLVTPDGMGNFTLVADTNSAGTFVPMQSFAGTYSVSSDGRTTTTGITSNSPIFYLTNTNSGVILGTGPTADFGYFEPQVGGPFTNSSLSGMFFWGTDSASAASRPTTSGSLTFDGIGNYMGNEDDSTPTGLTPSKALSNTYSFSLTSSTPGRGTLESNSNTVAYIISSRKLVFFDKTAAKPSLTIVEQ